jgi:hypothetical protein
MDRIVVTGDPGIAPDRGLIDGEKDGLEFIAHRQAAQ